MEKLVELSDHEILINFALNSKCRTNIRLKSLNSTTPTAFKLQTSSPHKFLVNPPSGLIPPLASTTFQIVLKPQSHLPSSFPRSRSDRFLLKTALAPELNNDSDDSTQSDLVNLWFNSNPDQSTVDVRLKVYFVGSCLLTHAVGAGDFEAVKGIFKRQRFVVSDLAVSEAESLYRVATRFPEILGFLLEAGLRVEAVRREVGEELHVAAGFDRTVEVERLIKEGVNVECKDKEGRTALHVAASKGCLGSAGVLVSAGANVDARSKDGRTALYRAAANGDRRMVEILLGAGADPTIGDPTAIDVARDKGQGSIVVKVIERGEAVVDAARRGDLEVLESLLERGAVVNFCDQYGLTALHVAAMKGNKDAVMMLVEFGADVDSRDSQGNTPLHLAVQAGNIETVQVLTIRGANVSAKTNNGATPSYIANLMDYQDIAHLLLGNHF